MAEEIGISVKDEFCLTIEEASRYFGIGEKKLRKLVHDNLDAGFVIQNGVKFLIKRQRFEQFLSRTVINLTALFCKSLGQPVQINMEIEPRLWYNMIISCRGSFHRKERNVSEKRRDSKNRILRNGESQRKDGRYAYKYIDATGKPQFVYSWKPQTARPKGNVMGFPCGKRKNKFGGTLRMPLFPAAEK